MKAPSYITITDLFCGAGGSSLGAAAAAGSRGAIRQALNHSVLACETHGTNFPETAHYCVDISATDPWQYASTTILLASPECTHQTNASGEKKYRRGGVATRPMFEGFGMDPVGERSRATMWDVPRFAEAHPYQFIIVENVVEAFGWRMWRSWWHAMTVSLDYEGRVLFFNSQFAHPTPQSRDRLYAVFWRKGTPAPNLEFTPPAWCPCCAQNVAAVQSWKNPAKQGGRYGRTRQYLYCCPACATVVRPYYYCAANAIDWSLDVPLIGERKHALAPNTIARIEAGLRKYGEGTEAAWVIPFTGDPADHPMRPVTAALPTQTTGLNMGLLIPMTREDRVREATEPWPTQTATQTLGLVIPLVQRDVRDNLHPLMHPLPTQTTAPIFGVLLTETSHTQSWASRSRGGDQSLATQTGQQTAALVTVPLPFLIRDSGQQPTEPHNALLATDPLYTQVAGAGQHALITAPFVVEMHGTSHARPVGDPLSTAEAGGNHHALVSPPPFLLNYQGAARPLTDSAPTVTTVARIGLVQPGPLPAIAECGFRMLGPAEIGRAMAFPPSYVVKGTQREQVQQYGNAVTPPVMQLLMERCLASLE